MTREYREISAFDLKAGDLFYQNNKYFRVIKSNPVNIVYRTSPGLPSDRVRTVRKDNVSGLQIVIDN